MHEATATVPLPGPARAPGGGSALAARLAASAAATEGGVMGNAAFLAWLEERQRVQAQRVRRIAFDELDGWGFEPGTGNLRHRSGRFFSVEGLRTRSDFGPVREWAQPIIRQPEFGILGIALREIGGVLHLLMQAKSEPGNVNGVQLSPTVQATKSNYSRVHGGSAVPYLDCFRRPGPGRVVADVLQSEQGSWFLRKRNRNMVVEVGPEVEAGEDFCWLTLGQVNTLLRSENLVNMDARTVLSCLPDWERGPGAADAPAHPHSETEVLSWITRRRVEHEVEVLPVPLAEVEGWHRSPTEIAHERGLFFSIVAVDVSSGRREVPAWSQPLLRPHGTGLAAFLVKRVGGIPYALVGARVEPGFGDIVELGPTVQCTPENYAHLPAGSLPPFLREVLEAGPGRTLFDVVLSEEGGRFHHALCRYVLVEVGADFLPEEPEGFRWLAPDQLEDLLRHGGYVNVQARTLVAALRTVR